MDKLAQLQEKRTKAYAGMVELQKKHTEQDGKWIDEEQRQRWEKVNEDFDSARKEIEELRAVLDVMDEARRYEEGEARRNHQPNHKTGRLPGQDDPAVRAGEKPALPTQDERSMAMALWCRSQMGDFLGEEEVALLRRCRINPMQRELVIDLNPAANTRMRREMQSAWRKYPLERAAEEAERRAIETSEQRTMSAITFAGGGALVPETYLRRLELNMLAFGGIRQVADTITTSGGDRMGWPTADDTSNTGVLLGESASIGSSVDPSFGMVFWDAYKFSSKPTLVPYEMLQDSWNDVPSMLGDMHGERLGRITATYHTTGTGSGQPKGIVTCASAGITAASQTAFTWDETIQMTHSIDPAYRAGASWLMHDYQVRALRLLKDGVGNPLWREGVDTTQPMSLHGAPLHVSLEMASASTTGTKVMLYGQLSKHKIRRAGQIRMYRMTERYRDNDQDGFVAFLREDSNMLDAGTAPVKYLALA